MPFDSACVGFNATLFQIRIPDPKNVYTNFGFVCFYAFRLKASMRQSDRQTLNAAYGDRDSITVPSTCARRRVLSRQALT